MGVWTVGRTKMDSIKIYCFLWGSRSWWLYIGIRDSVQYQNNRFLYLTLKNSLNTRSQSSVCWMLSNYKQPYNRTNSGLNQKLSDQMIIQQVIFILVTTKIVEVWYRALVVKLYCTLLSDIRDAELKQLLTKQSIKKLITNFSNN